MNKKYLQDIIRECVSEVLLENETNDAMKTIASDLGKKTSAQQMKDNVLAWQLFTKDGQKYFKQINKNKISNSVVKKQIDALMDKHKQDSDYFTKSMNIQAQMNRFNKRRQDRNWQAGQDHDTARDYEIEKDREKYMPAGPGLNPIELSKRGLDSHGYPLPQDVINKMASGDSEENKYYRRKFSQSDKNTDSRNIANQDTESDYK